MNKFYLDLTTKNAIWLLIPFFFITTLSAQPVIGTTTFDGDNNSYIASHSRFPRSGSVQGWFFYAYGQGKGAIYHNGETDPSHVAIFAEGSLTNLHIKSEDGSEFNLDHIIIGFADVSGNLIIRSYRDGNHRSSFEPTAPSSYSYRDYDLSNNSGFENIDEIRLSGFNTLYLKIDEITISAPTLSVEGINKNANNISIHPNPSSDYITIKNINTAVNYQIIDLNGAIIIKGSVNGSDNKINIECLSPGLFFLKIDGQQPVKVLKI